MTVSSSLGYESFIFLDEATFAVEADLHALFHDSADRDQFFCYGRNMQDIFYASLVTFSPEWDITDVPNGMRSVISGLYITGSIRRP